MSKRGTSTLYEEVMARKLAKRDEEEAKWTKCAPPTEGIDGTVERVEEAVRNANITKDGLKLQLVFFNNKKMPNADVFPDSDPWWESICKWHIEARKICNDDVHTLYYKFAKDILKQLETAWKEKHPKFVTIIYEGIFVIKD